MPNSPLADLLRLSATIKMKVPCVLRLSPSFLPTLLSPPSTRRSSTHLPRSTSRATRFTLRRLPLPPPPHPPRSLRMLPPFAPSRPSRVEGTPTRFTPPSADPLRLSSRSSPLATRKMDPRSMRRSRTPTFSPPSSPRPRPSTSSPLPRLSSPRLSSRGRVPSSRTLPWALAPSTFPVDPTSRST